MLSALNNTKQNAPENLTHIYTTITEAGGGQRVATPSDELAVLALRMPGSLTRSITNLNFGLRRTGDETVSFIILKTESFDTAFAGMFNWERFMSADLTPFFGNTVNKSLDLQSRTNTQIVDAEFVDAYVNNRHIRTLYDETGTERIVYGIIDQHTIVITENQAKSNRTGGAFVIIDTFCGKLEGQ